MASLAFCFQQGRGVFECRAEISQQANDQQANDQQFKLQLGVDMVPGVNTNAHILNSRQLKCQRHTSHNRSHRPYLTNTSCALPAVLAGAFTSVRIKLMLETELMRKYGCRACLLDNHTVFVPKFSFKLIILLIRHHWLVSSSSHGSLHELLLCSAAKQKVTTIYNAFMGILVC